MGEICEKHGVLKRSCHICELEEENKMLKDAMIAVKALVISDFEKEKIVKFIEKIMSYT